MRPLSGTSNILDIQENGYKNSIFAIAELIDNSIQANAKKIDIIIINDTTENDKIDEVLVIDNGDGMSLEVFEKALVFNSGTRSGSKTGLGKYGQGLPSASVSQTRRVEVYTKGDDGLLFDHLDLWEIHESEQPFLQDIVKVDDIGIPFIKNNPEFKINGTGTIVRWVKPNRLRPKNVKTLVDRIEETAGRIFRYYLHGFESDNSLCKCEINIKVFDYNGEIYSKNKFLTNERIQPFDPMFLMRNTQMDKLFPQYDNPTSEFFAASKETFIIKDETPNGNKETIETDVVIFFSYIKRDERYRFGGRNPGDLPFGKKYLKRNLYGSSGYDNISIVRAHREIDAGSFGFIGDISVPTNRWWSVEVMVEGALDHILGIDMKKQQASAIRFYDADYDEEVHDVLKWISTTIKNNISTLQSRLKEQSYERPREEGGDETPPIGPTEPGPIGEKPLPSPTDKDRENLFQWIKERYAELTDEQINQRVEWAFSITDRYIFHFDDLGDTDLYTWQVYGDKILVEVNYNHSFYEKFMKEVAEKVGDNEKEIRAIRLLICSLISAERNNKTDDTNLNRYIKKFKNSMSLTLDEYICDLYKE